MFSGGFLQSQYVHMIYRYKLAKTGCFYNILPLSLLYFKMFRILNKAIEKTHLEHTMYHRNWLILQPACLNAVFIPEFSTKYQILDIDTFQ